ncbi:hypothetical protein [Rhizobium sp.]|uniref:hypothetical protein n=1 Tax=Rhizobium sp. TaxID=391 RepID=UPI0028A6FD37
MNLSSAIITSRSGNSTSRKIDAVFQSRIVAAILADFDDRIAGACSARTEPNIPSSCSPL